MRVVVLAVALMIPVEVHADPPQFAYADLGVLCTPGALRACSSIQIQAQRDPMTGLADVYLWVSNLEGQVVQSNTVGSLLTKVNLYSILDRPASGSEFSPLPCLDTRCISGFSSPVWENYVGMDEGAVAQGTPWFTLSGLKGGPARDFPLEMATSGVAGCNTPGVSDYYQTCGARIRLNFNGFGGDTRAAPQFPGIFVNELALGTIGVSVEFGSDLGCASILHSNSGYNADVLCDSFPSTVTPEPGTLLLVGTGIAGMFGVARRRRRSLQDAGD